MVRRVVFKRSRMTGENWKLSHVSNDVHWLGRGRGLAAAACNEVCEIGIRVGTRGPCQLTVCNIPLKPSSRYLDGIED